MSKKKRNRDGVLRAALPGTLGAVDQTFDSIHDMAKSLDDFLVVLYKVYQKEKSTEGAPNLFGFIVRELLVTRKSGAAEAKITCDPGRGAALITLPSIPGESRDQWQKRQNETLSIYFSTLSVAQIQAKVQLFRLLTPQGRKNIGKLTEREIAELCDERGASHAEK